MLLITRRFLLLTRGKWCGRSKSKQRHVHRVADYASSNFCVTDPLYPPVVLCLQDEAKIYGGSGSI